MRHLSCLFILCALLAARGGSDDGIGDGTAAGTCADDQRKRRDRHGLWRRDLRTL